MVVVKTGLLKGGKEMQWGDFTVVSGDLLVILVMLLMLLLGITLFYWLGGLWERIVGSVFFFR